MKHKAASMKVIPRVPQIVEKDVFSLTEFTENVKKTIKKPKFPPNSNPFEVYGTKEMWDKIVELAKTN